MTMPMQLIRALTLGIFVLFALCVQSSIEASSISLMRYLHAQSVGFFQPDVKRYEQADPQYAMKLKMLGG
jgi:hypothetical protein